MLMLVDDANTEEHIRLAALVNVKTFLERTWKARENSFQLPEGEKVTLRQSLLNAFVRCVSVKKLRA